MLTMAQMDNYPLHDSQRGWFGRALYFQMLANPDILVFTGDLGFGLFDTIKAHFPDRFINCGAAEQAACGAAIGARLSGKSVFCFSITPFLIYRPFEWIRNYINHEKIAVQLIGSGINNDYAHDGITHHAFDAKQVLSLFPNIQTYFPERKEDIPDIVDRMVKSDSPGFLCLRR